MAAKGTVCKHVCDRRVGSASFDDVKFGIIISIELRTCLEVVHEV